jgi:hypothetical protein
MRLDRFGNHVTLMPSKSIRDVSMSQVIRINDDLYSRLEAHASGFDTPSNVIETILNSYEALDSNVKTSINTDSISEIGPASNLDISYIGSTEENFKQALLGSKKAYIKIYYTNDTSEIKEWNASKFSPSSKVDGNLRSGYLRGWKKRGIFKAELSVNREEVAQRSYMQSTNHE